MKLKLRRLLGTALLQSVCQRDITFADDFANALMLDPTMPHDTAVFQMTTPSGAILTVTAVVTYPDPTEQDA